MAIERLAGADGLAGKGFTLRKLAKVALGNRQYAGELWRDELVALCEAEPDARPEPRVRSTSAAPARCSPPGTCATTSTRPGAILFRRFVSNLLANFPSLPNGVSSGQHNGDAAIYDVPFDPADPVNTPRGLNTDNPLVGAALADAVTDLARRRHPARRDAARVPVRGSRRQGDPDPRRPGNARGVQRDQRAWDPQAGYPERPARLQLHRRDRLRGKRGCPVKAAHLRHLRPVREPALVATRPTTRRRSRASAGTGCRSVRRDVRRETLEVQRLSARRSELGSATEAGAGDAADSRGRVDEHLPAVEGEVGAAVAADLAGVAQHRLDV